MNDQSRDDQPRDDDRMDDTVSAVDAEEHDAAPEAARRRRRLPIPGTLVAIDAPEVSNQPWVVDAIDINGHGIGLVLPPEVPEGTHVLLSFSLGDDYEVAQVPGIVRHRDGTSGGVSFGAWRQEDRLHLLAFLVEAYERA